MDSPRTNWRIEEDEDGCWSLLYTGDGKTAPIYGFAATFPLEEDARFILARLQSTDPSLSPDQEEPRA